MFDGDYVTKPSSFILPFVLLLAGGAIGTYWIWWLGITVCILAGLITLWLVIHSTLDRVIAMIEASTEYYTLVILVTMHSALFIESVTYLGSGG